jgi:chemotaxis response regulator CheB
MKSLRLALLQRDPQVARYLSGQLCNYFQAIHIARNSNELRDFILRFRSNVVVVDMESASLAEVERLHREFVNLCIVCTHRLADEEMWTAALDAGATDICSALDTRGIVLAATRDVSLSQSAAA